MDMDITKNYLVLGFIDGKDEKQSAVSISLLSVVTRKDLLCLDILASSAPSKKDLGWEEMLPLLRAPRDPERPPHYEKIEVNLKNFIDAGRHLQAVAKNRNTKAVEQAINRFCGDNLSLRAVTFLNVIEIGAEKLALILEKKETPEEKPKVSEKKEGAEPVSAEKKEVQGVFIRCEPVLDPVRGVAVMDLQPGDVVFASLPPDSVFYKLFFNQFPQFDGTINAEVTQIVHNDTGSATVSMDIAEDISGLMKMTGRVRVKMLRRWYDKKDGEGKSAAPSPLGRLKIGREEMLFGVVGGIMLLVLLLLMFSVLK